MLSAVLTAGLCTTSLPAAVFAEDNETLITELNFGYEPPVCGTHFDPASDAAGFSIADEWEDPVPPVEMTGKPVFVTSYDATAPYAYTAFEGDFTGGETYTVFFELKTNNGYRFDKDIVLCFCDYDTWADHECVPVVVEPEHLVIAYECEAVHNWDADRTERTEPTCIHEGSQTRYCLADPSHIVTTVLPVDETAHSWGAWETVTEADALHEGKQIRSCALCGKTEESIIPRRVMPYTKVYEPETSWAMSATIAWRADADALEIASADIRPATCFVWLDADLNVFDRNGSLLSADFDSYVRTTAPGMIPAFYISDQKTAEALESRIQSLGLADCFVVSSPENKELVKDVADLLYVRGMIDCSEKKSLSRKDITDLIAAVNGSHGKTLILSEEAATKETIRLMQSLTATVWVRTSDSTGSIMRAYTRGANGIVTDDYPTAIRCEEFFQDDAPTLLRTPLIIGHRGDPSVYVENTLDSAKGAFAEGVDSVENDIHLTTDGELFILHDDYLSRFFMVEDTECESLTLDELRAIPFRWESIITDNEVSAEQSRDGRLYGQEEQKEYIVPTLKEYIEAFKDTGLVHDTEIKSLNPAIVPVFKEMVDSYDAWDQFFCITFNEPILDALYKEYPEISIAALLFPVDGRLLEYMPEFSAYQTIENESGAEEALRTLCRDLDRWNAVYAPVNFNYGDKTVEIGRHRGMTVWAWTYYDNETFSRDYLRGLTGMTTDCAWKTTGLIDEISAGDVTAENVTAIPKPAAVLRSGETTVLDNAEPVQIEALDDTRSLMLWRYKADLVLGGESCGAYYLYSEPFVFTSTSAAVTEPTAAVTETMPGHIATDEALCSWAVTDYQQKTGTADVTAKLKSASETCYEIVLSDSAGNVLEVYRIDPQTGTGTDSADAAVDLPQTGSSSVRDLFAVLGALMMVGSGAAAAGYSRIIRRKKHGDAFTV